MINGFATGETPFKMYLEKKNIDQIGNRYI